MRHSVRAFVFVLLLCAFAGLLACGDEPVAASNQTADGVHPSDQPLFTEDAHQPRVPPPPTLTLRQTRDFQGTVFELQGCTQTMRLIRCEFRLTNTGPDRFYRINLYDNNRAYTQFFDQQGHEFAVTRLKLADIDTNGWWADKYLIAETPIQMTLFFDGVASSTEFIKVLNIGTTDGTVQFRDIRLSPASGGSEGLT